MSLRTLHFVSFNFLSPSFFSKLPKNCARISVALLFYFWTFGDSFATCTACRVKHDKGTNKIFRAYVIFLATVDVAVLVLLFFCFYNCIFKLLFLYVRYWTSVSVPALLNFCFYTCVIKLLFLYVRYWTSVSVPALLNFCFYTCIIKLLFLFVRY